MQYTPTTINHPNLVKVQVSTYFIAISKGTPTYNLLLVKYLCDLILPLVFTKHPTNLQPFCLTSTHLE